MSREHVGFVLTAVATFCLPSVFAAIKHENGDVESCLRLQRMHIPEGPTRGDVEAVVFTIVNDA